MKHKMTVVNQCNCFDR